MSIKTIELTVDQKLKELICSRSEKTGHYEFFDLLFIFCSLEETYQAFKTWRMNTGRKEIPFKGWRQYIREIYERIE